MVYRLAQGLKVALEPETASCLYLTLVTDTGGFRFSNATAAAFEAAAALVREGAHPEQVSQWLYESQPLAGAAAARRDAADARRLHDGGPGRHRAPDPRDVRRGRAPRPATPRG